MHPGGLSSLCLGQSLILPIESVLMYHIVASSLFLSIPFSISAYSCVYESFSPTLLSLTHASINATIQISGNISADTDMFMIGDQRISVERIEDSKYRVTSPLETEEKFELTSFTNFSCNGSLPVQFYKGSSIIESIEIPSSGVFNILGGNKICVRFNEFAFIQDRSFVTIRFQSKATSSKYIDFVLPDQSKLSVCGRTSSLLNSTFGISEHADLLVSLNGMQFDLFDDSASFSGTILQLFSIHMHLMIPCQ